MGNKGRHSNPLPGTRQHSLTFVRTDDLLHKRAMPSKNSIDDVIEYYERDIEFAARAASLSRNCSGTLPYSVAFLTFSTASLVFHWAIGIPLGLAASYGYPVAKL